MHGLKTRVRDWIVCAEAATITQPMLRDMSIRILCAAIVPGTASVTINSLLRLTCRPLK